MQHHRRADRRTSPLEALARDTRYALRRLVHDWRFTIPAIVILGLGIGANTAIFSVVNAALLRQQPFHAPERLVDIYQNGSNPGGIDANSYPAYQDIAAYTDIFTGTTAVLVPLGVNYLDDGALRRAVVEHTTATYLSVLGLRPALGRWFTAAEDMAGVPVVAVLSHQAWMRKFHGDAEVIGRTIPIEGVPVTIVGVGPAGYRGTVNIGLVTDFWLPIRALQAFGMPPRALDRRPDEAGFFVKARLRDGVTVEQAQAAMNVLAARLATEYPNEDPGKGITLLASSDVRIHPQMDGLLTAIALLLIGVVGLVLAIACSNLATLLLVRATARAREVAVRLALGAARGQLVRHLLTESLLLSLAGGIAGCLLASWGLRLLGTFELPFLIDLRLDYRVLIFAVGLSIVTGLAFGLAPALRATRVDLVSTLRGDGAPKSRQRRPLTLKNALVVFQVAVSVVLLGGTSIFLQMLDAAQSHAIGFATDGIAMVETDVRYAGSSPVEARRALDEVQRRVEAIPGVRSVVVSRGLPMRADGVRFVIEGAPPRPPSVAAPTAGSIWVGPGYFDLLGIPILFGRALDDRDREDTPRAAVISETMARRYFGVEQTASAVGRRFRLEGDNAPADWIEVVGVARDTGTADRQSNVLDPTPEMIYRSFAQWNVPPTTVLARTSLDASALAGAMQREVRGVNASLPIVAAKTMAEYLDESLVAPRALAGFLALLGGLGVWLAGVGLYAVVAFTVSRRSREIGIRMALGARPPQVVWSIAREVAALVGAGTAIGLLLTLLTIISAGALTVPTPGISLYRPTVDPLALVAIAAFMIVVGAAAACVPARRATRLDPLLALRRE